MDKTGQESIALSYGRLQEQFGTGIAEEHYRQFRKECKTAFRKVDTHWRTSNGGIAGSSSA